jgi:hypothetical protein
VVPRPGPSPFGACFGGYAEWKPKYHVLYVISSGSFNLATLDKVEPCKPPIRRRPTETARQFIERAMRENHGYTVPARWLADLDAIPDGDTGEPESGYLVGIETPTDPTPLEPLPPNHGRPDTPTAAPDPRGRPAMTELTRAELAKELGFRPATAKGWAWAWQRCGRHDYRKCLTRSTNPDHPVPSAASPTNVRPLRIADRYVAGRKHG